MNPFLLRSRWRRRLLQFVLAGAVLAGADEAIAQAEKKLDKNVRQYLSFDNLSEPVQARIGAAIDHYDNGEYVRAIAVLQTILAGTGKDKPKSALRAWTCQWLALNYFALKDSSAAVQKYVERSLDADVEIWREYAEPTRMSRDLHELYRAHWDGLQQAFDKKHKAIRLGLGSISRLDFSYRFRFFEIMAGVGAPIVVDNENIAFKQLLIYTRFQRLRRAIERLSPGFYFEFALLEEDLSRDNIKTLHFGEVISAGIVMAYPHKTGMEIGGSFELARLFFKQDNNLSFNQTKRIGNTAFLSYGNFEIYLRKWF
ncbi:hypothetical protein FBQ85_20590 [Cytophagia bacterium CHB2]|nr:hypothetical protein [Cytophagia bacterium CHB2]